MQVFDVVWVTFRRWIVGESCELSGYQLSHALMLEFQMQSTPACTNLNTSCTMMSQWLARFLEALIGHGQFYTTIIGLCG